MSIPAHGAGRRDLTRPDEQRAAAPETTPGQAAPVSLRADLEATVRIWREESDPYPEDDAHDRARRGGIGYCADELAQVLAQHPEPQPAPELAAAMREARHYRDAITALADWLKTSAAATHPSKKSSIEFELIRKLQKILEGK